MNSPAAHTEGDIFATMNTVHMPHELACKTREMKKKMESLLVYMCMYILLVGPQQAV